MRISRRQQHLFLLLGIIAIAIFLRTYHITTIPSGIYPDEANNAVDAITALAAHDYRWFYPANNGREGLFINMIALSFALCGIGIAQLKLVGIVMGVLTVIGVWMLARELFVSRPRVALLAAYLTAVSFWAVNFSRIGFRANMMLPVLTFGFAFLLRGARTRSTISYAIGGCIFGLGLHTYIAFRVAPALLAALLILFLLQGERHYIRAQWRGVVVFVLCAFLSAAPMLRTFQMHPEYLVSRTADISVFAPSDRPLGKTLITTITTSLLQFNVTGDQNWRHNYPPLPQLEPIVGIMFLIGIAIALWRACYFLGARFIKNVRNRAMIVYWFLIAWFAAFLAPAFLTTEGLPHALRSIGTIPPVMIFAALAMDAVIDGAWYHSRRAYGYALAGTILLCVYTGMFTMVTYFALWGFNPAQADAFNKNLTDIGTALAARPANDTFAYVVAGPMERLPIQFLTARRADVMCVYPEQLMTTVDFARPFIIIFPARDDALIDLIARSVTVSVETVTLPLNSTFTVVTSLR